MDCRCGSSFFSVLVCGVAVGLYFLLRPHFGTETLSWMCILGAAPFALIGFVKYNGMTAEQFLWAWIKSEFLMPKRLLFSPDNLYYEALKETIQDHEREAINTAGNITRCCSTRRRVQTPLCRISM